METLDVNKFISLPESVETLGEIICDHAPPGSEETLGVIKSLRPTSRVTGDFRSKNILKHRVYTDFRGN